MSSSAERTIFALDPGCGAGGSFSPVQCPNPNDSPEGAINLNRAYAGPQQGNYNFSAPHKKHYP